MPIQMNDLNWSRPEYIMFQCKQTFISLQEDSKAKIGSVLQDLCDECKLEIYQEDNSDEIIVSGKYVEGQ